MLENVRSHICSVISLHSLESLGAEVMKTCDNSIIIEQV